MADELRTYKPDHVKSPGQVLKDTLADLDISHSDFIRIAQIDRDYYYRFLAGKAPLSEDLAIRLEKWAKLPTWVWQKHERKYREYLERRDT